MKSDIKQLFEIFDNHPGVKEIYEDANGKYWTEKATATAQPGGLKAIHQREPAKQQEKIKKQINN